MTARSHQAHISDQSRHQQAASALLDWYDAHHRDLPWRVPPAMLKSGQKPDPYHVWLSEIMLQQTTVPTVKSYFNAFTARWPKVTNLAAAPREEVMAAWAGLGYYARARNLHKTAEIIAADYNGAFPDTEDGLRALPGIGGYTAAAIAAIAFGRRAVVVDGNIERVTSRWAHVETPLPKAKPELYQVMDALTPDDRAGDFAQAMMDLGTLICTPPRKSGAGLAAPSCLICPLQDTCATTGTLAASLPRKLPKKKRPTRRGLALIITDDAGRILLERRGDRGMLGGMDVFPGSAWADGDAAVQDYPLLPESPAGQLHAACGPGQRLNQQAEHIFSHFKVYLDVEKLHIEKLDVEKLDVEKTACDAAGQPLPSGFRWVKIADLPDLALPTVMVKTARIAGVMD